MDHSSAIAVVEAFESFELSFSVRRAGVSREEDVDAEARSLQRRDDVIDVRRADGALDADREGRAHEAPLAPAGRRAVAEAAVGVASQNERYPFTVLGRW